MRLMDVTFVCVVVVQVLCLTYARSPRWKSFLYMLPIPFSFALLSSGRGVDITHVAGFWIVWGLLWGVYLLHTRRRVPIVVAITCGVVLFCLCGVLLARWLPSAGTAVEVPAFWVGLVLIWGVGVMAMFRRHGVEPGHRTRLPAWIKIPLVVMIIVGLIESRPWLRGFMPTFPLVTIFVLYEARYSLRTLVYRVPIFLVSAVPMLVVLRVMVPFGGGDPERIALGLGAAWLVFVPVYLLTERWYVHAEKGTGTPTTRSN